MNEQLKELIAQQQKYEYLKKSASLYGFPNTFSGSEKTNAVLLPCLKKTCKKRRIMKLLNILAMLCRFLILLNFVLLYLSYALGFFILLFG